HGVMEFQRVPGRGDHPMDLPCMSMRRRVAFDVNARVRRKPDAGEPPAGVEVELTAIGPAGAPAIRRLFRGGDPPSTAVGLQEPPAALALLQARVVREGPVAPQYAGLRGQAVVMPDEFQAGRRGIGRKIDRKSTRLNS